MTINKGKTNEELVQKYLARKKAREQEPKEEPNVEEPLEEKVEGDVLIYAAENKIILLEKEDKIVLRERKRFVTDLCMYEGELYEIDTKGDVSKTCTDTVRSQALNAHALCSHNGRLFGGGKGKLYNISEYIVEDRDYEITSLCSHDGELYEAAADGKIYRNSDRSVVAERKYPVWDLCSASGILLDAGEYRYIARTFDDRVYYFLSSQEMASSALCQHNKSLLYALIEGGIKKVGIIPTEIEKTEKVNAMLSIDPKTASRIKSTLIK
ncbi:hypothetical protein GOV06_04145 [Candidatus Woesearchaeota archaeon]|nr:hypothetical protein [Candidatus Woesearchaeota archaeon]